ncbi:MAG TPA: DUF2953 domain-containing protein [Clostridiaceae bacterium]|nr:DUF2953 domain-containing protein [Clostridiaceae bacterium]
MLYLVIFTLILTILILFLLFSKAEIGIEYIRTGNDDLMSILIIALSGIFRLKLDIPLSKYGEAKSKIRVPKKTELGRHHLLEKEKGKDFSIKDLLDIFLKLYRLIKSENAFIHELIEYMTGRVRFVGYELEIEIGAGEAYYTALTTGLIWAAYGLFESYLYYINNGNYNKFFNDVNVYANFDRKSLLINLYCIFNAKVANIINISFKILKFYIKSKQRIKKVLGVDTYV